MADEEGGGEVQPVVLTYTNPLGHSVEFRSQDDRSGHIPHLLQYITGVGGVAPEYENMPVTGGFGSRFGAARYPSRTIQTGCMIYGKTDAERDKRLTHLLGVLNPALGDGTLNYQNHYGSYRITARCKVLPSFSANSLLDYWKPVLIDYECRYPFFQGLAEYRAVVASLGTGLMLPFQIPFTLGDQQYSATAYNPSTVAAPVEIRVYGPAVRPTIINRTTGDAIALRKTVNAGEWLMIRTGPYKSAAVIAGDGTRSDAMNYINLISSQWIYLAPGTNQMSYSSGDESLTTRVEIYWNDWYLGVG